MNVVDPVLYQCKLNPSGAAISVPGGRLEVVSYGRLERFIHNAGRNARAHGLRRGQIAGIVVNDVVLHATLMLALTRLGIITVSLPQPVVPQTLMLDALLAETAAPVAGATRVIRVDAGWLDGDGKPMDERGVERGCGDDICRLLLTSGSTSESKAVAMTHRTLRGLIARHDFAAGNRFLSCSRLYYDQGMAAATSLRYLLAMLSRGGTIFFHEADALQTIQAFELYKVQGAMTTPASLAVYAQLYEAAPTLQTSFDVVVSNGGPLTKALAERVQARICSNLFSAYGTTETGTVAVASAPTQLSEPGAVGFVVPDISVEIVDGAGNVQPDGREGLIRIRSPYSPGQYFANPEASAAAFRDGWFYPGDLGRMTQDRFLFVTGRQTHLLHVGGHKIAPEHIEDVLTSVAGVARAAVVTDVDEGGAEEIVALLVTGAAADLDAIAAVCAARLPESFVPARYLRVDSLPLTPQGKLARRDLLPIVRRMLKRV